MKQFKSEDRIHLDGKTIHEQYKRSIESYKRLIHLEEFLPAYLLIYSMWEERLIVCWVLSEWFHRSPTFEEEHRIDIKTVHDTSMGKMVDRLKYHGYLVENKLKGPEGVNVGKIKSRMGNRNTLLHMNFWNSENISKKMCDDIYTEFRRFDKLSQLIKKKTGFERKE